MLNKLIKFLNRFGSIRGGHMTLIACGAFLAGCPEVESVKVSSTSALASCEILQNWQQEGNEAWNKAIKAPDGTYTLCGEPFHKGAVEGQCILPSLDDAVMVKGQAEDYPHHRIVGHECLDDMYGGINGPCKNWNCEDIWDKAGESPGCTSISARRTGTCEAMWGIR